MLWEGNVVEEGAMLRACVIGHRNHIGARTSIMDGTIISDDCTIGRENRLSKGIRLWPGMVVKDQGISF
jgi:mannose-1-phosphate guanylyltransferase